MKILTRFLFREILHYFMIFLGIAIIIMIVNEVFDSRSDFFENNPAFTDILRFLIYSLPEMMVQVLPLIGLITCIFAFGLMAKNRELLAMVAAGVSFRRLAMPAVVFGIGLTCANALLSEYVVPYAKAQARIIRKVDIMGGKESIFTRRNDLFVKGKGSRFYFMERYLPQTREMLFPTIFEVNRSGSGLAERIEAERAVLVTDEQGKGNYWEFSGAERWVFGEDGRVRAYERYKGNFQLQMEDRLDLFLSRSKDPSEMNFAELKEYRDLLAAKGGENLREYSLSLWRKFSFPLACALMALLGYCVVADVHARRFARGVFAGLLVAILFYVVDALLGNLGEQGIVAPMVAAMFPILVFLVVDFVLLRNLNRVRG